jgi:hypothetical protein
VPKINDSDRARSLSLRGRERSVSLGKLSLVPPGLQEEGFIISERSMQPSVFECLQLDAIRRERQKLENEMKLKNFETFPDMHDLKIQKSVTCIIKD